jgi:hypothetical protein
MGLRVGYNWMQIVTSGFQLLLIKPIRPFCIATFVAKKFRFLLRDGEVMSLAAEVGGKKTREGLGLDRAAFFQKS